MDKPWTFELETAKAAVRLAAMICRNVGSSITPDARAKKDKSPVTVADYASQAVICRALSAAFPNDPIVAEEDSAELRLAENEALNARVSHEVGRVLSDSLPDDVLNWIDLGGASNGGSRFWTLDPIDGTKGFLRGEQYAIALALVVDGCVEVAVLGCPNLSLAGKGPGVLLFAVRGSQTMCAGLDPLVPVDPVRVSTIIEPTSARFCELVESGHSAHDASAQVATGLGFAGAPQRLDSQAKYAVVAAGQAEVYLRLPTRADYREKIWDHAAGSLVIESAGGQVSDIDGKPLNFSLGRELSGNRGVVATNARLHNRVIEAISTAGI